MESVLVPMLQGFYIPVYKGRGIYRCESQGQGFALRNQIIAGGFELTVQKQTHREFQSA